MTSDLQKAKKARDKLHIFFLQNDNSNVNGIGISFTGVENTPYCVKVNLVEPMHKHPDHIYPNCFQGVQVKYQVIGVVYAY